MGGGGRRRCSSPCSPRRAAERRRPRRGRVQPRRRRRRSCACPKPRAGKSLAHRCSTPATPRSPDATLRIADRARIAARATLILAEIAAPSRACAPGRRGARLIDALARSGRHRRPTGGTSRASAPSSRRRPSSRCSPRSACRPPRKAQARESSRRLRRGDERAPPAACPSSARARRAADRAAALRARGSRASLDARVDDRGRAHDRMARDRATPTSSAASPTGARSSNA